MHFRFGFQGALMAVLPFCLVTTVSGFWRMECRARSGIARMDPLVANGSISEHVHNIFGSNGFGIDASPQDLLDGTCTSCAVTQDKSAYWTPPMYFQDATTGEFTLVQDVGGMLAYYELNYNPGNDTLTAFPPGFRMIAGNTNQRNFSYPVPDIQQSFWDQAPYNTQAFLEQVTIGFNCLDYSKTGEPTLYRHYLPSKDYIDANCVDGLRTELMFPACWDGVNVDSHDYKSHVKYASLPTGGVCPDGFPVRLPTLLYETIWNTPEFAGRAGQFVLANGDPTGYGYHGDFMMGWDEDFLQEALDTCTNKDGEIGSCPLFSIDSTAAESCTFTMPSALSAEDVVGPVTSLPGNVPIVSGPAPAGGATAGGSSNPLTSATATQAAAPLPTLSYSAGTASYLSNHVFDQVSATSSSNTETINAATVTSAPSASTSNESFFSTQYTTSGAAVLEVLWVEEVVTVTQASTTTVIVPGRKRHLRKHLHQGHI